MASGGVGTEIAASWGGAFCCDSTAHCAAANLVSSNGANLNERTDGARQTGGPDGATDSRTDGRTDDVDERVQRSETKTSEQRTDVQMDERTDGCTDR